MVGILTKSRALMTGSRAINAGDDPTCYSPFVLGLDHSSYLCDSPCDIGAYEFRTKEIVSWNLLPAVSK
jgi:hypothetical protein